MDYILPEFQAYFMKSLFGFDFIAIGANDYGSGAHTSHTDINSMAKFVLRYLKDSYDSYTTGFDPDCDYEKTCTDETKTKDIANWKRRKRNRYNKAFRLVDQSKYSFWITFEKTTEGFFCKYWSDENNGSLTLDNELNENVIRDCFINAYNQCVSGIHYLGPDSNCDAQDEWSLEQYIDAADKYFSVSDDLPQAYSLLRELLTLSKHTSYNLINAEGCPLYGDDYMTRHIIHSCAIYHKEIGEIDDDEFLVDALEKCILGGVISVAVWKQNNSAVDLSLSKNKEILWERVSDYDLIQNWKEHLLQQEDWLRIANVNGEIEKQMVTVVQFLYSFSCLNYQKTKEISHTIESYGAAYLYGQIMAMYFT